MANSISGNVSQLYRSVDNSRNVTSSNKAKGATNKEAAAKKTSSILDKFGESAKVEFSPEVEMYGKAVDLLQKKYDNADIFVAGPDDDLSQIGGDLEYSIILSEDEMKLLASDDPKDKEAKDKLLGQIDDAMKQINDMSDKISENTSEEDEIENFGIRMGSDGKFNFFADINGKSFEGSSVDSLIKTLASDKE